eukprot:124247-Alexandrium_andersonii.AAC.1
MHHRSMHLPGRVCDGEGSGVVESDGFAPLANAHKVATISKDITDDLQQKVDKFTAMAKNIVNSNCEIAPETLPQNELLRRLKDSAAPGSDCACLQYLLAFVRSSLVHSRKEPPGGTRPCVSERPLLLRWPRPELH